MAREDGPNLRNLGRHLGLDLGAEPGVERVVETPLGVLNHDTLLVEEYRELGAAEFIEDSPHEPIAITRELVHLRVVLPGGAGAHPDMGGTPEADPSDRLSCVRAGGGEPGNAPP